MKRWIPLFVLFLLVACGGGDGHSPAAPSFTPSSTTMTPPATPSSTVTLVAAESTPKPPTPRPLPEEPARTERPTSYAGIGQTTLGPPVSVCAGEGLTVAEDGVIYALGRRDGQHCASTIDLVTGSIEPADLSAVPMSSESSLEIAVPTQSRVYVAESDRVIAYDDSGREIDTVLILPPGEPGGFTFATALRLDERGERLYLSYQDYDGQSWIAMTDLVTGKTHVDVPVPSGPWTLVADSNGTRLFFSDGNTLVVLDGATLDTKDRLSLSRRPASAVVDPSGMRLFVTDAGGDLHVLDARTLAEQDRLPGVGTAVDLDPRFNRLYVGDRHSGGLHVFDLATLEPAGHIPQPGRPIVSPADGRVFILEEDVYQADGATLQLIRARTTRKTGCNGCAYVSDIVVDPHSGRVYTVTNSVLSGKPGPTSQATFDPKTGRAFIARTTGGYQPVYSVALYPDLTLGAPLRWIDGLYGQLLYDPVGDRLYLAHNARLLVLDGQTLQLLAGIAVGKDVALLAVDEASGSLYATWDEQLLRLEFGDLDTPTGEPEPTGGLPGPVYGIVVSPKFSEDGMLFAVATDWETGRSDFYRSRDGGASWARVGSGLPSPPNDVAIAPDGRLYAAVTDTNWRTAPESAAWGEGVYTSDDNGNTWRPYNAGLTHLRVGQLYCSDNTLYVRAAAAVGPGLAASGPTLWVRHPGNEWAPVSLPEDRTLSLVGHTIPPTYTLAVQVRWHELTGGGPLYQSWGQELRRSDDGGQSWRTIGYGPTDYAEDVVAGSEGVYWIGPEALWRSTDEGTTWSVLRHPSLADGPPFSVTVETIDGVETLFLGTDSGQVLIAPVDAADWKLVRR